MQIHQFHPTVSYGDAISNHILILQRLFRRIGYRSEVFCEQLPLLFEGRAREIAKYDRYASSENLLLLHFSIGYSPQVLAWLKNVPDRKVLVYHNITPHTYFVGINDVYLEAARAGRSQLGQLSKLTEAGWGDSEFNCQELVEHGWTQVGVLPIAFNPKRYTAYPDRRVMKQCKDGMNVLFVGRIAPNKRVEDIIITFYYLKHFVRPDARLLLVGSTQGMEPYLGFLQALVKKLDLRDVVFAGHVTTLQLTAYYRCASVYLSMSEHEGFGVPFLESMHFGVPIVAYEVAAVPETLGSSGVLVTAKDHAAVAELIGLLAEDSNLRARVVARQRERLRDFMPEKIEKRLRSLLKELAV